MAAYYNELDPAAASWLRELIKRGLIADGEVDERSILDVSADDVLGFTQCHFFAGIGGWSYALRLAGWPDDRPVWTGSPPCQPFSAAGKQLGRDDPRHLAPHFVSMVRTARPAMLFGEQVASAEVFGSAAKQARGKTTGSPEWAWIDDLSDRLEAAHYAVGASDIPAAGVGAPHIRQRTFFGAVRMADTDGARLEGHGRYVWQHDAQGWQGADGHSGARCVDDRMADADQDRRIAGDQLRSNAAQCNAEHGGGSIGMADAPGGGRGEELAHSGRSDAGNGTGQIVGRSGCCDTLRPGPTNGHWRDADWLYCRDAKWRAVEPGITPLVDGSAARVGRLRGYGNAIVPQAAAAFIQAFTEAIE